MTTGLKAAARPQAIDLHPLPKPAVVEPLNYEAILAAITADFQQRIIDFSDSDLSESDPAMKLLEVAAWRELLLRQRINEAARSNLLAFASGSDLDHLAAFYGVTRLQSGSDSEKTRKNRKSGEKHTEAEAHQDHNDPQKTEVIPESDNALRHRLQAKIAAGSTAGSKDYYRYQALSSDPRVKDVCCDSPESGVVRLSILSTDKDGLPDESLLKAVRDHVTDEAVRVLTDQVVVISCEPCVTAVVAEVTLNRGVVAASLLQQAKTRCGQQLLRHRCLGWSLTTSWLIANLFIDGMARLELITPTQDLIVPKHGIVRVSDMELRCRGVVT